ARQRSSWLETNERGPKIIEKLLHIHACVARCPGLKFERGSWHLSRPQRASARQRHLYSLPKRAARRESNSTPMAILCTPLTAKALRALLQDMSPPMRESNSSLLGTRSPPPIPRPAAPFRAGERSQA
ncbi:hypothetical protein CVT26_013234, partial [Gymnopilus dilepis]